MRRNFTEKEQDYLYGIIHRVPRSKIPYYFNKKFPPRSETSIISKCEKMEESLIPNDDYFTAGRLSKYLGFKTNRVVNWRKRKLIKSTKIGRHNIIKLKDFKVFGLNYPHLIANVSTDILLFIYDNDNSIVEQIKQNEKPYLLDKENKQIKHLFSGKIYNSITEASQEHNTTRSSIRYWLKKGEVWQYVN
jgi:hypothetical protein